MSDQIKKIKAEVSLASLCKKQVRILTQCGGQNVKNGGPMSIVLTSSSMRKAGRGKTRWRFSRRKRGMMIPLIRQEIETYWSE